VTDSNCTTVNIYPGIIIGYTKVIKKESTWIANASLISNKPISSIFKPAFSKAFRVDGTGQYPIISGSTPANGKGNKFCFGFKRELFCFRFTSKQCCGSAII
jgi:hypothetical protein